MGCTSLYKLKDQRLACTGACFASMCACLCICVFVLVMATTFIFMPVFVSGVLASVFVHFFFGFGEYIHILACVYI